MRQSKLAPEVRVRRAIIGLQKRQPFFANLLMRANFKQMPPEAPHQTMMVDAGGNIYFAESFIEGLRDEEIEAVLCHEVLHIAFLHVLRIGARNREIANIAQDVIVNCFVTRAGMHLPERDGKFVGIPYNRRDDDSRFNLCGVDIVIEEVHSKMWEQVYEIIKQQLGNKMQSKMPQNAAGRAKGFDQHAHGQADASSGEDDNGQPNQDKEMSAADIERQAKKWTDALTEAAIYAKKQGSLPAGMERHIDGLLAPKQNWRQLLTQFVRPYMMPVDWSYRRLHKKSHVLDIVLPNVEKEHIEIEVIIDTSGSIGDEELKEFLSEIVAIGSAASSVIIGVQFGDTKVYERYEVAGSDIPRIMAMQATGGGGTNMENCLQQVAERQRDVSAVIVFTDGYTSFRKSAQDFPFEIVWVLSEHSIPKKNVPYGTVIKTT